MNHGSVLPRLRRTIHGQANVSLPSGTYRLHIETDGVALGPRDISVDLGL